MKQYKSAKRWLTFAARDLKTAKNLLEFKDPDLHFSSFASQQAAEKSIKAFLIFHGKRIEKTHDIQKLAAIVCDIDGNFEELLREAMKLTPYAIAARYPDADIEITLTTTNEAIDIATKVFNSFLVCVEDSV